MQFQTLLCVKVVPVAGGRYSYEWTLGRGFVRRARKIRRGVIRFWFKEGFSVHTVLVSVSAPWSSQVVDGVERYCEAHADVSGCEKSVEEGNASCRGRKRLGKLHRWLARVSLSRGSMDVALLSRKRVSSVGDLRDRTSESDGAGFEVAFFCEVVCGSSVLVGRQEG